GWLLPTGDRTMRAIAAAVVRAPCAGLILPSQTACRFWPRAVRHSLSWSPSWLLCVQRIYFLISARWAGTAWPPNQAPSADLRLGRPIWAAYLVIASESTSHESNSQASLGCWVCAYIDQELVSPAIHGVPRG